MQILLSDQQEYFTSLFMMKNFRDSMPIQRQLWSKCTMATTIMFWQFMQRVQLRTWKCAVPKSLLTRNHEFNLISEHLNSYSQLSSHTIINFSKLSSFFIAQLAIDFDNSQHRDRLQIGKNSQCLSTKRCATLLLISKQNTFRSILERRKKIDFLKCLS